MMYFKDSLEILNIKTKAEQISQYSLLLFSESGEQLIQKITGESH